MLDPSCFAPLVLARLTLRLEALEPVPLHGFHGPTLRGMLGHALREVACDRDGRPAFDGPNVYYDVFEPPAPQPGEQPLTPPYILHPPPGNAVPLEPGETLNFGLTLFGDALNHVPTLLWALHRYGQNGGLSRDRRRVRLAQADVLSPIGLVVLFRDAGGPVPSCWDPRWSWTGEQLVRSQLEGLAAPPDALELEFTSPLDLREQGHPVTALTFSHLMRSLLRNASAHARLHSHEGLELDFRGLKEAAAEIQTLRDDTRWIDVEHDSSRQQRRIPIRTRLGRMTFAGPLEPFLPLVAVGVALNIGKGRTMGFGGMDWRPVASASSRS